MIPVTDSCGRWYVWIDSDNNTIMWPVAQDVDEVCLSRTAMTYDEMDVDERDGRLILRYPRCRAVGNARCDGSLNSTELWDVHLYGPAKALVYDIEGIVNVYKKYGKRLTNNLTNILDFMLQDEVDFEIVGAFVSRIA